MDGILLIDKPPKLTSFQVVREIRNLTKIKKVGHGGTLDPMATGVLPIFLGKATKSASVFLNGDKGYLAEMTLGITTDTLDTDGKIIQNVKPQFQNLKSKIEEIFHEFTGEIEQIPPMFSAIHHEGERLYDLARKGIEVERKPRKITIHKLILKDIIDGDNPKVVFEVLCSKGTYIRSLVADIGEKLGCGAHLSKLARTFSQPFVLSACNDLEAIKNLVKIGKLDSVILPVEDFING